LLHKDAQRRRKEAQRFFGTRMTRIWRKPADFSTALFSTTSLKIYGLLLICGRCATIADDISNETI
jgi:hypothetical protein